MKNTGVVRKIDELGRIVIPKEIRKNLNIHNNEDVQIYVEEDKIILKKYQVMEGIKEKAQKYIDGFSKYTSSKIYVSDKEMIIASNIKDNLCNKIDSKIINAMNERKEMQGNGIKIKDLELLENYYVNPIIIDADAVGAVFIVSTKEIKDVDKLLVNILNMLLCSSFY